MDRSVVHARSTSLRRASVRVAALLPAALVLTGVGCPAAFAAPAGPVPAVVAADAPVLVGQPTQVAVHPESGQALISWMLPQQFPAGWTTFSTGGWSVYQIVDGQRKLVATTDSLLDREAVVTGLTAGQTASFVVEGPWGEPASQVASGTAATRELMWVATGGAGGLMRDALEPEAAFPHLTEGGGQSFPLGVAVSPDHGRYALVTSEGLSEAGLTTLGLSQILIGSPDAGAQVPSYAALAQTPGPITGQAPTGGLVSDRTPAFSPDGRTLVFSRGATGDDPNRALESLNLATGTLTPVPGGAQATDPAFTPDGHALIAVDLSSAQPRLVRIDLTTGARTVLPGTDGAASPAVSPDGRTVVFRLAGGLATAPVAGGTAPVLPGTTGIPGGLGITDTTAGAPSWSTDGTQILFPTVNLIKSVALAGGTPVTLVAGTSSAPLATPVELATAIPAVRTGLSASWSATGLGYGAPLTVHGRLSGVAGQLGGRKVAVQFQVAGSSTWSTVTTAVTNADGAVSASVRPSGRGGWRLVYAGAPGTDIAAGWLPSASANTFVQVWGAVTGRLSASRVARGATVTVTGAFSPAEGGTVVYLQRWNGRAWTTVGSTRESGTGAVSARVRETVHGTVKYRLYKAATNRIAATVTGTLTVTVN